MIRKILTTYATRMEEYLSCFHNRPEGLAMVGQIGNGIYTRPSWTATNWNGFSFRLTRRTVKRRRMMTMKVRWDEPDFKKQKSSNFIRKEVVSNGAV